MGYGPEGTVGQRCQHAWASHFMQGTDRSQGSEVGAIKVQDGRKNKRAGHACVGRDVVEQGSGWAGQESQKKMRDYGRWALK